VYSLSFAHSLIPHVNGFYAEHFPDVCTENETQHLHHHYCDTPKDSCIQHNNHCDDNVFDLLICLLSDAHSHHSDDDYINNSNSFKEVAFQKGYKSPFYLTSNLIIYHVLISQKFKIFNDKTYCQPLINYSFLRGPPVIS
jgi:hypothetical protein